MGKWNEIGGGKLVQAGITPMWREEAKAKRMLEKGRKVCTFRGTAKETEEYRRLLQEELRQGIVIPVPDRYVRFWNTTFLVPKKGGESRKILNCKKINGYMQKTHFKMEDCKTVRELLIQGDYATSIDLKSAYSHVSVHPSLRPYLGFNFEHQSYVYVGMPFGLQNAPRVFTKIMKVVMWHIRQQWGVRSVCYLDDLLLLHQDPHQLTRITDEIVLWLGELSLTVNHDKSALDPKQVFPFLGWEWNRMDMTVRLGQEKRTILRTLVNSWI
jgi:hypothetical protein